MGTEFLKENTAYLTLLDLSASNAAGERDMISAGSIIVLHRLTKEGVEVFLPTWDAETCDYIWNAERDAVYLITEDGFAENPARFSMNFEEELSGYAQRARDRIRKLNNEIIAVRGTSARTGSAKERELLECKERVISSDKSKENIDGYIRTCLFVHTPVRDRLFSCLIQGFRDAVVKSELGLSAALELSYLGESEQRLLYACIQNGDYVPVTGWFCYPTLAQAATIRRLSENGHLNGNTLFAAMWGSKGLRCIVRKVKGTSRA